MSQEILIFFDPPPSTFESFTAPLCMKRPQSQSNHFHFNNTYETDTQGTALAYCEQIKNFSMNQNLQKIPFKSDHAFQSN